MSWKHRKRSSRGEGLVSVLVVLALVVLVCIMAAQALGADIIALIMGTQKAQRTMEQKVDDIRIDEPVDPQRQKREYPWLPQ